VLADLRALAAARRLADWMFSRYVAEVGASTVEIGAGIGTFSERLLAAGTERLLLVEPDPGCATELERRFAADPRVEVSRAPIPGSPALADADPGFDLAVCQNVLEHIDDERGALAEIQGALQPGGTLALLVPAHPGLYGSLDLAYGHRRRYTLAGLERLLAAGGWEGIGVRPFNALGIVGWWASSRLGRTTLDRRALRAFDALVPVLAPAEKLFRPPWGLSLTALARSPGRGS
jgi:SAM-dependent methyltransferase